MAATDWLRRIAGFLGGVFGGVVATTPAHALNLPEDKAEGLFHLYDGGGVRAYGPAFLVRKSLADKVSVQGSWYVDAVSNASIDVVTMASPFKETRHQVDLSADYLVRDSLITLGLSASREPDYRARTVSLDVAQEVFGGMTTVNLGFSRGADSVGQKIGGAVDWLDTARHWQYRLGVSQVLSPRWMATANLEVLSDDGYLGSPYRLVVTNGQLSGHENLPRTRTGRALKLGTIYDSSQWVPRSSLRAEYRYYWDTWAMKGHTLEFGASRYVGDRWLADAFVRFYKQNAALFYSDNATVQTLYLTRNRQLSRFDSAGLGGRVSYAMGKVKERFDVKLNGGYEYKYFHYGDFTDLRTGSPYSHGAHLLQLYVTATY